MSNTYLPNVILGALDAIGPEPLASGGLSALYIWRNARLRALRIIVTMDGRRLGFINVPDQGADSEAA